MRCAQRLALSVACTFAGWLAANVLLLVVDLAWDARYALTFTVAFASSAALLVGATWLVLVAPLVALAPRAWLIFRLPWGVLFGGTVGGALGLLLLGSLGCLGGPTLQSWARWQPASTRPRSMEDQLRAGTRRWRRDLLSPAMDSSRAAAGRDRRTAGRQRRS